MSYLSRFFRPSFGLRLLSILLLMLPLTKVFDRSPFREPEFALVLDTSPSMERRFPGYAGKVLSAWKDIGNGTLPAVFAGEHPRAPGSGVAAAERFTDLASALEAAAALLNPRAERRILLVSDGLSEEAGLAKTLEFLSKERIRVFALAPPDPLRQAAVTDLIVPSRVFLWEPFTVRGHIISSSRGEVTAVLKKNGVEIASKEVAVDSSGTGTAAFIQEAGRVGAVRYSMELQGYGAPPVTGEVRVASSPRLRYIGGDLVTAGRLIGLFRRLGIEVTVSRPSDILFGGDDLSREDIIILDDLPPPALSVDLTEQLQSAVAGKGRGLLVIGGRKGLGSEGYRGSGLESLRPVTTGYSTPPRPSAAALTIAMDTSFSMAYRGRGRGGGHSTEPRKIDIAKEGVREVVKVLRPEDRLGILGNSTDLFWIEPLGFIGDRDLVLDKIDRVKPLGDGINFYSIVSEAYRALREVSAPIRHILVFGDSEDIDQYEVLGSGHSYDLIRRMVDDGITLSVLAIGQPTDKDVSFLRTTTLLGRGDFYLVSNLRALPKYFVSEYRKLSSRNFVEESIKPLSGEFSLVLNGVQRPLPTVDGMATLTARKDSRTPVLTDLGPPLVTIGRYGAGRTAVFASDNGYRWASRWVSWPGAEKFWLQLLFAIAPDDRGEKPSSSPPEVDPSEGVITLRRLPSGLSYPTEDRLWLHPRGGSGDLPPLGLVRTGLFEYRGGPSPDRPGFYRYLLTDDREGSGTLANLSMNVPPPPESFPAPENWRLIESLVEASGGDWISAPADITMGTRSFNVRRELLFTLAVGAGLFLLLVETVLNHYFWR